LLRRTASLACTQRCPPLVQGRELKCVRGRFARFGACVLKCNTQILNPGRISNVMPQFKFNH
jgi:hypothetical protein